MAASPDQLKETFLMGKVMLQTYGSSYIDSDIGLHTKFIDGIPVQPSGGFFLLQATAPSVYLLAPKSAEALGIPCVEECELGFSFTNPYFSAEPTTYAEKMTSPAFYNGNYLTMDYTTSDARNLLPDYSNEITQLYDGSHTSNVMYANGYAAPGLEANSAPVSVETCRALQGLFAIMPNLVNCVEQG